MLTHFISKVCSHMPQLQGGVGDLQVKKDCKNISIACAFIWQGVHQLDIAFAWDLSQGESEGLLSWASQGGGKKSYNWPHPQSSSTFRGSMSSIASSARDLDPIQRRSTSSSSPLFLSSACQGSIKKGYTPGGSPIPIAMSNKIIFNSCWSSYGRSPFRLTCTESFENAFLNES